MEKVRLGNDVDVLLQVMRIDGEELLDEVTDISVSIENVQYRRQTLKFDWKREPDTPNTLRLSFKHSDIVVGKFRAIVTYNIVAEDGDVKQVQFDADCFEAVKYSGEIYSDVDSTKDQSRVNTITSVGIVNIMKDGRDGITPEVGPNGNWWYNGVDSGFPSRGIPGEEYDDSELRSRIASNRSLILQDLMDVSYDSATGIMTFKRQSGTTFGINLPLENVVKSGYYDTTTQELVLVLVSGDEIRIPAEELVEVYVGSDGEEIQVVVSDTNVISAILKNATISRKHLSQSLIDELNSIPTLLSQLTNDTQYVTLANINSSISQHNQSSSAHEDIRTDINERATEQFVIDQVYWHNANLNAHESLRESIVSELAPTYENISSADLADGIILSDNYIYSVIGEVNTATILGAGGYGMINFLAGSAVNFVLPSGSSWDGDMTPTFFAGRIYTITYSEFNTWYADSGR